MIGAHAAGMLSIAAEFAGTGNYEVTPPTRAFSSEEAFRDLVGKYAEIGMSELIFYFPDVEEHRARLEKIAAVLPERRSWA